MLLAPEVIVLGPCEGRAIHVPGHPVTFKVAADGTGGAYSLFESVVPGNGPIQHIHETEEEAFYVLEGKVNIKVGEQIVRGTVRLLRLHLQRESSYFPECWSNACQAFGYLLSAGIRAGVCCTLGRSMGGDEQILDPGAHVEGLKAASEKYNEEVVEPL